MAGEAKKWIIMLAVAACLVVLYFVAVVIFAQPQTGMPSTGSHATSTLIGDVSMDGQVDCTDVEIVRSLLGKRKGQPGFVAAADVNNDGVIDQDDLDIVASHLPEGMGCPPTGL